ncbi:MAG: hypothetical protein ACQETB_01510 [Halobacteriota archaeon]
MNRRSFLSAVGWSIGPPTLLSGCLRREEPPPGEGGSAQPDGTDSEQTERTDSAQPDGTDSERTATWEYDTITTGQSLRAGANAGPERPGNGPIAIQIDTIDEAEVVFEDDRLTADSAADVRQFVEGTQFETETLFYVETRAPTGCYSLDIGSLSRSADRVLTGEVTAEDAADEDEVCSAVVSTLSGLIRVATDGDPPTHATFTVTDGWGDATVVESVSVEQYRTSLRDGTVERTPDADGTIEIRLANTTSAAKTVRLQLFGDGDLLFDETVTVEAESRTRIDPEIDATGAYELSASVEDGPEASFPFSIDDYALRAGSNLIVTIREESVDVTIEE